VGSRERHDELVEIVANVYAVRYNYRNVHTEVEYEQNGLEGEMDVYAYDQPVSLALALRSDDNSLDDRVYHEVKSYTGGGAKAVRQLKRAYRAGVADWFRHSNPERVERWTP